MENIDCEVTKESLAMDSKLSCLTEKGLDSELLSTRPLVPHNLQEQLIDTYGAHTNHTAAPCYRHRMVIYWHFLPSYVIQETNLEEANKT